MIGMKKKGTKRTKPDDDELIIAESFVRGALEARSQTNFNLYL
jgi:hypothetical protein